MFLVSGLFGNSSNDLYFILKLQPKKLIQSTKKLISLVRKNKIFLTLQLRQFTS